MAITALTLYPVYTASTMLPTARAMVAVSGSTTAQTPNTPLGTALGWGEIAFSGTTGAWPALNGPDTPSGLGALFDANTLDNQQIVGGAWSATMRGAVTAGTLTADLYLRIFLYQAGTLTPVGTLSAPAQTFTTTNAFFNFTGTLNAISVGAGDRIYVDFWANVTTNSTGNNASGFNIQVSAVATQGTLTSLVTTPGYQPLTQQQLAAQYSYGAFNLNDGINYFVIEKPLALPEAKQVYFKVARYEGVKKTGEVVNEQPFRVKVKVVGASRPDLEGKIDALMQALSLRQQRLMLHNLDARYWVADAVRAATTFVPGRVIATDVDIDFVAQQPYALSPFATNYATGSIAFSNVSGSTWQATANIVGGGTTFARPTITLVNNTAANNNTLAQPASPAVNTTVSASTAANATSITVAANTNLTGTGTVVLDVSPGTANQETATFNLPATGTGPYTLTVNSSFNGGALKNAHTSGDTIRTVALGIGFTITSVPVVSLAQAVVAGQQFILSYTDPVRGALTMTVTASAAAAAGATAISVNSVTTNANYLAGATSVNMPSTNITAITIQQTTDGTSLTVSGLTLQPTHYLTINCDVGASGYIITQDGGATPLAFSGVFPVQEPTLTGWTIQATANNQPTISAQWSWTPRYLS